MRTDFGYAEEKDIGKPYDLRLMQRLYPFVKPYKLMLIASVALVMVITLIELSLPYLTKIAIDRYIVPVNGDSSSKVNALPRKETRLIQVDISDPKILAVVNRYPHLFSLQGSSAVIDYARLQELPERELLQIRQPDISGLNAVAVIFLLLVLINFGLNFIQVMIMETNGQKIMHDLRQQLFEHIQGMSIAFFAKNPVGRLVTRVTNDVQNMHELFTSVIVFIFKDLFLLAGITIVLLSINVKLALISFAVIPMVLYAALQFSTHAREAFRLLRVKIAEINTRISETVGGIAVIQLFGKEQDNYRQFRQLNHEHYQAGMRQIEIFAVFMPVIELLGTAALAVVIYYGSTGVLSHSISLGALVAFISYVRMFFRPIRDIAEKYNILQNAMASAERIFLLLDTDEPTQITIDQGYSGRFRRQKIESIRLERLSFAYVADEPVLQEIDLDIQAGETVAIVGPTGSGKTTLINLIPRFYDPVAGRILINQVDTRQIDPQELRHKIALVPQDPFVFSVSLRDNINPDHAELTETQLASLLQAANCDTLINQLPQGLDTVLSEGGDSISSGERQLLSIARALAHDPELIILDEATSYIDAQTEEKIQSALANLMKDRTTIMVAHRLTTARFADKIVVLNRGRIIELGTHQQLMQKNGFYAGLSRLHST